MTQQKPDPIKSCAFCGKVLTRRRSGNRLEDLGQFTRRRFCDRSCFQNAMRQALALSIPIAQPDPTPGNLGELEASPETLKAFDPAPKPGKRLSYRKKKELGIL